MADADTDNVSEEKVVAMEDSNKEERPGWQGISIFTPRMSFLAAAIGSAVGLGNIWRFPYLCNKYGGGAFLIPYFICLFLVGHPILQLELALGQKFRSGDIDAFGSINRRLRGIGLASIFGAFLIVCYYCVIISWSMVYFANFLVSTDDFNGFRYNNVVGTFSGTCDVVTNLSYPLDYNAAQTLQYTQVKNCYWPKCNDIEFSGKDNQSCFAKLESCEWDSVSISCRSPWAQPMTCTPVVHQLKDYASLVNPFGGAGKFYSQSETISCDATYRKVEREARAQHFYYNKLLSHKGGFPGGIDQSKGNINGWIVLGLFVVYLGIFIATFRGVKSTSYVVMITMPLPFLLLIVLMIQAGRLEGAGTGIEEYLTISGSKIGDAESWSAAIGQVFFSLGVCMGILTAYSSYNPPEQNVVEDNHIIAFADTLASLFGGFVVYSVLGYLSVLINDPSVFQQKSIGLTFISFPQALSAMPGNSQAWGAIFFLCLIMLGIDSAFALVEAFATVITDRIGHEHQRFVVLGVCIVGFFIGLRFCTDTGLYWLDLIDYYINNFGMIGVGMLECLAVGWFYENSDHKQEMGPAVDFFKWSTIMLTIVSVGVGLGIATAEGTPVKFTGGVGSDALYYSLFGGIVVWLVIMWISYIKVVNYRQKNGKAALAFFGSNFKEGIAWKLFGWHGPEMLRELVNSSIAKQQSNDNVTTWVSFWRWFNSISLIWGFLIKYFIPPVLWLILCSNTRINWYSPYGDYPGKYQAVGILIVVIMLLMIIFPLIEPDVLKNTSKSHQQSQQPLRELKGTSSVFFNDQEGKSVELNPDPKKTDEENARDLGA